MTEATQDSHRFRSYLLNAKIDHDESRYVHLRKPLDRSLLPRSARIGDSILGPVLDQGKLGSCVANGCAYAVRVAYSKPRYTCSRLYTYYNGRVLLEKWPADEDSGLTIADGIRAVKKYGAPSEKLWPYEPTRFAEQPSKPVYETGKRHQLTRYYRLQPTAQHLKSELAAGFPVVFGIQIYDSFFSDEATQTGDIPLPDLRTETCSGGHCITLIGYDDEKQRFTFRNSWGSDWGNEGNGTLPYAFVLNPGLAGDFWSMREVKKVVLRQDQNALKEEDKQQEEKQQAKETEPKEQNLQAILDYVNKVLDKSPQSEALAKSALAWMIASGSFLA